VGIDDWARVVWDYHRVGHALTRRLLAEKGLQPRRAIAVQKPYMERRTLATFRQRWPELDVRVTSPRVAFDDYPTAEIRKDDVIHIMVGDLQRLAVYARKGWSAPQEIPPEVLEAWERLVAAGYTGRLLPEDPGGRGDARPFPLAGPGSGA
jgi:uncharacterized SAM-binding protein YcdF (DUF218 family)